MLQTCRQFLNFIDPVPKSLFYPSKRTKERKEFVSFSLSFRQTASMESSQRKNFQTFFLDMQKFATYSICILSSIRIKWTNVFGLQIQTKSSLNVCRGRCH